MARFKLLQGQYIQNDPGTSKERTYNQGDTFDCDLELDKLYGYDKFERLGESVSQTPRRGYNPTIVDKDSVEDAAKRGFNPATSNTGQDSGEVQKQEPRTMHDKPTSQGQSNVSKAEGQPGSPVQGQTGTLQGQPQSQKGQSHPSTQPRNATEAEYFKNLSKMNVNQLREHAESEEIDLKGANTRDDILRAIRESTTTNL